MCIEKFGLKLLIVINIFVLTPFNDALIKYIDHNTFIKEKIKEVPQAYIKLLNGLKSRRKHRILY
jgi:UDP-N-acetylmuramyl pentapeptide phosphotransferase/UDP-N-acetylglucosamine-1-phosphate transferase